MDFGLNVLNPLINTIVSILSVGFTMYGIYITLKDIIVFTVLGSALFGMLTTIVGISTTSINILRKD